MSRKGVNLKHGCSQDKGDREYWIWVSMRARCRNPKDRSFKNYGARGISVCERWNSFLSFLEDMGRRPSPSHTLERINNDLGYGPENCRWATRMEQANNNRRNRSLTIDNRTLSIAGWARESGNNARKIWKRLDRGWDPRMAVGL